MNEPQTTNSATEQIASGKVQMRSRGYFFAHRALRVGGVATLLMLVVYLVSYVLFQAKLSGAIHLSEFGMEGLFDLLLSLPKIILLLVALLLLLLVWFYEQFPLGYHRPLLISLLGVILVVATASFLVHKANLHSLMLKQQDGAATYKAFGLLPIKPAQPKIRNGTLVQIIKMQDGQMIIQTQGGEELEILLGNLKPTSTQPEFQEDDWVIVKGELKPNYMDAYRILRIPAPAY